MSLADEQALIERTRQGDQAALGQLLQAHQGRLYNVCLRLVGNPDDAAEVTQDALVKIIEHIQDFRSDAKIGTWMTRILMNQAISFLRKRKLRKTISLDMPDNGRSRSGDQARALRDDLADPREPDPLLNVQRNEQLALLRAAIAQLDEPFRLVLVLRDIDEMDYQQIADVLDLPVGTVKSRLFRARLALRTLLRQEDKPLARVHGEQVEPLS